MLPFILRRLAQAVIVMLTVAFIAFMLFQDVGDPVTNLLGQDATPEQRQQLRADLGLDKPFPVQFAAFVGNAARGELVVAPAMTAKLAQLLQSGSKTRNRGDLLSTLTERERQILDHLARGESNKTIARALDISHDTVKLHVRHILAKLNLSSRVEAAVFAVESRVAGTRPGS